MAAGSKRKPFQPAIRETTNDFNQGRHFNLGRYAAVTKPMTVRLRLSGSNKISRNDEQQLNPVMVSTEIVFVEEIHTCRIL
jgi:hypothetical protein